MLRVLAWMLLPFALLLTGGANAATACAATIDELSRFLGQQALALYPMSR
jgi:hypothetical protein